MSVSEYECEVCGAGHGELAHESVVIRDGARGQYLAPTLVGDVAGLVGQEKVPEDVRGIADRWLEEMGSPGTDNELTPEESERMLDWTTYQAPALLADVGLVLVEEDGYVIFRRDVAEPV